MKKNALLGLLTIAILLILSACGRIAPPSAREGAPERAPIVASDGETSGEANDEPEYIAVLVADMSFGSGNEDLISRYEYGYDDLLTVELMAQGLSELTGLDFAIYDSAVGKGGVSVDWALDATFLAGLGEIPQKDEFFVYDSESLAWFMLDSMYRTIYENGNGNVEVFYSMNGWEPLMIDAFAPDGYPVDMSYTTDRAGRGDVFGDGDSGYFDGDDDTAHWDDAGSRPNLVYVEEYQLMSDSGDNLNAAEAAKLTFDAVRDGGAVTEYSDDTQYMMTLIDLMNINGEECYVYRLDVDEPSGTVGAAYACSYQSGSIYMQGFGGEWVLVGSI